jgi:hypothetical protein
MASVGTVLILGLRILLEFEDDSLGTSTDEPRSTNFTAYIINNYIHFKYLCT